ncbi:MAG TPA: hypothetical protein VKD72_21570, partial [Gemmataceae bacterium]|nr:hypothetical protein [Gemmataceae bacterium]
MTATKAPLALAFACLAALAGPAPLCAQEVRIVDVGIGFPAGEGRRCRPGNWCPVHVSLAGWEDGPPGEYEVVVETADSDDVLGQYVVSVPRLTGRMTTVLAYYRPGNRAAGLKAIVRKKGGAAIHSLEKAPGFNETLRPEDIFYLAVGGQPKGLRNALVPTRKAGQEPSEQDEKRAERGIAVIDKAGELPDRWFGYAGVDVVVLSTSGDLIHQLLAPSCSAQVGALGEWVRRGGRLVVGAGRNGHAATELLHRFGLRNITRTGIEADRGLQEVQEWAGVSNDPFPGNQSIMVTRFRLGGGAVPLVRDREGERSWPMV